MITCSNLGRNGNTGNSMFQFAALIGISKKTGFNYFIPKHESYFDVNYNCMNFSIFGHLLWRLLTYLTIQPIL